MTTSHHPRPFQFGLRRLFELTAVVALIAAGWRLGGLLGVSCVVFVVSTTSTIWAARTERDGVVLCSVVFMLFSIMLAVFAPAIQDNRGVISARSASQNTLKQIGMAIAYYAELHGHFPPAVVYDEHGQPLHSWRTLLLPYLEQGALYNSIRLNEPWNSPHNRQVLNVPTPYAYRMPFDDSTSQADTSYVALIAPDSIWSEPHGAKLDEITDGPESTLIVIEMKNSGIHWAEPRDLDLDNLPPGIDRQKLIKAISPQKRGIVAVYADGHVEVIPSDATIAELKAAASKSGGDRVDFELDRQRIMPSTSARP